MLCEAPWTSVVARRSGLGWAWPGPAMCVVAVMARLGEVRLDMAVEVGSVEVRQRKARCGKAVRVGLGEVRLAWLGVARRSWLCVARRGGAGRSR